MFDIWADDLCFLPGKHVIQETLLEVGCSFSFSLHSKTCMLLNHYGSVHLSILRILVLNSDFWILIDYWGHVYTSKCSCPCRGRGRELFYFLSWSFLQFNNCMPPFMGRLHPWQSQMQLCLLLRKCLLAKVMLKKKLSWQKQRERGGEPTRKGNLRVNLLPSHSYHAHCSALSIFLSSYTA